MRGNQPGASMPQARCPSAKPSLLPWFRSQENARATRGADNQRPVAAGLFLNRVGLERRRARARMPSSASSPQRIASLRAPKAERRRNAAGMVVIHGNPACGMLRVLQHTALASWLPAPARQRQLARASPRAAPFAADRPRPAHACAGTNPEPQEAAAALQSARKNWDSGFRNPILGSGFLRAFARHEAALRWPPPNRAPRNAMDRRGVSGPGRRRREACSGTLAEFLRVCPIYVIISYNI